MYALIQSGIVHEIIQPLLREDGTQIPLVEIYSAELVEAMVPADDTVEQGDLWNGQSFSHPPAPTLAQTQAAQIAILDAACQAAIMAGFSSNALGTEHTYPAQMVDQQNLSASVLASLMPNLPANWTTPFWCADSTGTWSYANHTAAQIQQAGQDGKAAVLAAIQKKNRFVMEVNAATTVAAVQAIVWD